MTATIFVIDDDVGILDAMQDLLEFEGYNVVVATRPELAFNLLQSKHDLPDLILLDVLISGSDGRDVCRALKNNPRTQHIPIIMMSAHPGVQASVQECGAEHFLSKPYDMNELLKRIETQLAV